ncbi:MAG: tetratricopeptide repeat protein [Patescibacteria group bacterium]
MNETTVLGSGLSLFSKWGSKIFLAFAFLLPIFFVPSQIITFQFGKGFFLFAVSLVLSVIFLLGVLREGKISFPKSLTSLGLLVVLFSYIVSGAFNAYPNLSLVGQGFETDTAFFILVAALISFLVPIAFRSKTSLFNIYLAVVASFFVAALFNVVHFFVPSFSFGGLFSSSVANLVGTWNDLGVFAGFITLFSLISLGVLEVRGVWRIVIQMALVLGVAFLAIVNFNTVWIVVASFTLVFFLYSLSYAKNGGNVANNISGGIKNLPWSPIVVFIISITFLFFGTSLGNAISGWLNITQLEARPSWSTTISIAKETLKENPIIGAGPNQFVSEWLKYRPQAVNESLFWNVDFTSGIGTIPTAFITLGGVGIVAWLIFFILFGIEGFRAIRRLRGEVFTHYLAFSSWIASLYFWIIAIFYTPGHVMYALAFLFTGVFIATLVLEGVVEEKHFDFSNSPGKSFVGSLITIVFLIVFITSAYLAVKRFVSYAMFNRAIIVYSSNRDLNVVEERVKKSLAIEEADIFFRTLTDIYLARLQDLAGRNPSESEIEALRAEFQQYLSSAVASAQAATVVNPMNYQNWLSLARVYENIVPFRIDGAYEQALTTYDRALSLNPTSPLIVLSKARLEIAKGNNAKAREYIAESLKVKNNYTDAIFLLTQLEVSAGNTKKAIEAATSGTLLAPTNPVLFFQLGLLHYNDRNSSKAIEALEQAVRLENQYANARYFLGLSYDRLGKTNEAIAQFEEIQKTNSDNAEVKLILENLRSGRTAFARVEPPLDDKPEKRQNPPVSEE